MCLRPDQKKQHSRGKGLKELAKCFFQKRNSEDRQDIGKIQKKMNIFEVYGGNVYACLNLIYIFTQFDLVNLINFIE